MTSYLYTIAKDVLIHEKRGISKVRFAKTLYFIHKELVRKNKIAAEELSFIRMPLGPVPAGFMELHSRPDISTHFIDNAMLSYNTQIYTLKFAENIVPSEFYPYIEKVLKELEPFPTSQLVEISHSDPSWIKTKNGEKYCITLADLENIFPKALQLSNEIDEQRLQARLVSGMIDDIVEESTSLEYPQSRFHGRSIIKR